MKKYLALLILILMMTTVNTYANNPFEVKVNVQDNIITVDPYIDFTFVVFTDKFMLLDKSKPLSQIDIQKSLDFVGQEWSFDNLVDGAKYIAEHSGIYTLLFYDSHDKLFMVKQVNVEYNPNKAIASLGEVIGGRILSTNNKYLQSEHLIESDDEEIIKLAETLSTPRDMLDWVHTNIKYDYDKYAKIEARQLSDLKYGAKYSLSEKKGVCYDQSALFVALCRAKGIPALIVCGAYDNLWHSWAMFFDGVEWVHVEPTSGNYNQIPSNYKLYGEYKVTY